MRYVQGEPLAMDRQKAVVLVSGGLDSAVTLFYARENGYDCRCLTFDYGQRHASEIEMARRIAQSADAEIKIVKLDFTWKGSSLLDKNIKLPVNRTIEAINSGIPNTYVPARNTVFLSIATSFAEATGAGAVFIGAHSDDSSGYPDCRIEYLNAFNEVIRLGTRRGSERDLELKFPLIRMKKSEIIKLGLSLGVPFQHTMSCYQGTPEPCAECDSCILRAKGFREAGISDPLIPVNVF